MPRSNEFTHGGSNSKNLGLLLRALVNIIATAALGFGASQIGEPSKIIFGLDPMITNGCLIGGAVLTVICLVWNLFGPFIHRKK